MWCSPPCTVGFHDADEAELYEVIYTQKGYTTRSFVCKCGSDVTIRCAQRCTGRQCVQWWVFVGYSCAIPKARWVASGTCQMYASRLISKDHNTNKYDESKKVNFMLNNGEATDSDLIRQILGIPPFKIFMAWNNIFLKISDPSDWHLSVGKLPNSWPQPTSCGREFRSVIACYLTVEAFPLHLSGMRYLLFLPSHRS